MARRLNVQRLLLVFGVLVIALGALCLWVASRGGGLGFEQPNAHERAVRQVREQMGPTGEVRYAEVGTGRALCGYAGLRGQTRAVSFVSRPNRILFSDDPLPEEFKKMQQQVCPSFLAAPPGANSGAAISTAVSAQP